jgi:ADP-L-glycero-D-manno-heptose 6-epimerase
MGGDAPLSDPGLTPRQAAPERAHKEAPWSTRDALFRDRLPAAKGPAPGGKAGIRSHARPFTEGDGNHLTARRRQGIVAAQGCVWKESRMIVVTGGAGFIGSALVYGLNQRGITDILVVDELGSSGKWKNLRSLAFSDYMDKEDFLNLILDDQAPESVEAVLHMGACSSTTETDVSFLIRNNFEYTKQLALWAEESGIRFVYASSAATYGDGSQGFDDEEEQIDRLRPLNPYGYSKQLFDLWARREGLLEKITGLKYFNVFGPNEYHKGDMRSFVLKGFEQITATGKVRLFKSHNPEYGDGEYVRDFIYIKDAVDMTLFFLDNREFCGLFNVGSGQGRTWNDYVKAIFAAMDRKPVIEYVEMPESIRHQYQYFSEARVDKIHQAGYDKAPPALEETVVDYVVNYLEKGEYLGGEQEK